MNSLRLESLPPDVVVVVRLLADLLAQSRVPERASVTLPAADQVPPKLLLRMEEAAELLSISRTKVYQLIYDGELPVVRIGRSVRVPMEPLREWIRQRAEYGLDRARDNQTR